MQNTSRKFKCAIDKITLKYNVTPFIEVNTIINFPLEGVYINGFYCEGFRFEINPPKVHIETA
jgi:hypothetical protein